MTLTSRCSVLTTLLVLLTLASALGGCTTVESSSPSDSPTFVDYPTEDNPRLQLKWRQNVGVDGLQTFQPSEYAGPVLIRRSNRYDMVAGTRVGDVVLLRAGDGKVRWRTSLNEPIHGSPAVAGDRIFVGTLAGTIAAIDRQTGDVQWKIRKDQGVESQPATTDRAVFVTTTDGTLHALDRRDGSTLWTYERSTPREFTIKGSGAPVVEDGTLYCGFSDGALVALDAATGSEIWTADLSGGETEFADVIAPIVVREDRLYAASYASGIYAVDRETGALIWTNPLENVSSIESAGLSLYATLATGRVVGVATADGSTLWGLRLDAYLPVESSQAGPYLFVSTSAGPVYVVNRSSGHPLFRWDPSSGFNTGAVFTERRGYLLSNRGYLYGFNVAW